MDLDQNNEISFEEFLGFVSRAEGDDKIQGEITKMKNKEGKEMTSSISSSGAKHSYSDEEKVCFARVINEHLKEDHQVKDLGLVPINIDNDDLFKNCNNGLIFCKLVNKIQKDTIDERIFTKVKLTDVFKVKELINLALSSIKSLGVKVISIDAELILKATPHLILGLLWQIVKILLIKDIDLNKVPEILRLKEGDEEMDDLIKLNAEKLLIRWMNWHLNNAGTT